MCLSAQIAGGSTTGSGPVTYYIDYAKGSDHNAGTSKTAPWKLAPGMVGFAGAYTHKAGDRFVFKGGVTWPKAALPLNIRYSGVAGAVDVYGGEDQSWHSGRTWSQPIFDGQQLSKPGGWLIGDNARLRSFIKIDNLLVRNSGNAVTGVHDGLSGANDLTDATKNWTSNEWVGRYLYDTTDGSQCKVTLSTTMTAVCTLAGGAKNIWTPGDAYVITDGSGTAISFSGGGSNIEVSGCTLQPRSVQAFSYADSYLPQGQNSGHIYFHDNKISLGGRMVVYGYTGHVVDDVQIYRNKMQGAGTTPLGGYHLDGLMIGNPSTKDCVSTLTPTVTNILFHDNYLYGSWPGSPTALYFSNSCTDYTFIYNNVFAIEAVEKTPVGFMMRWQAHDGDISIYNNTMSVDANPGMGANARAAILISDTYAPMFGTLDIENNIFSGFGEGIEGSNFGQFSSVTIDYDLFNPSKAHGYGDILYVSGSGKLRCATLVCAQAKGLEMHAPPMGAPQFTTVPNGKVGSGDFHPTAVSPALRTGVNLYSVFTTDLDNEPRPSDGVWDIGALGAAAQP